MVVVVVGSVVVVVVVGAVVVVVVDEVVVLVVNWVGRGSKRVGKPKTMPGPGREGLAGGGSVGPPPSRGPVGVRRASAASAGWAVFVGAGPSGSAADDTATSGTSMTSGGPRTASISGSAAGVRAGVEGAGRLVEGMVGVTTPPEGAAPP